MTSQSGETGNSYSHDNMRQWDAKKLMGKILLFASTILSQGSSSRPLRPQSSFLFSNLLIIYRI